MTRVTFSVAVFLVAKWTSRKIVSAISGTWTLLPEQVGIGAPSPCEAMIHATNHVFNSNLDNHDKDNAIIGLSMDAANAFNNADRAHILQQLSDVPTLRPLFNLAFVIYGHRPQLFADGFDKQITSANGTMQGCPLGSLLFCIGLQPLIRLISEMFPELHVNGWLADDGNIIGPRHVVKRVYDYVKEVGPMYGYHLNDGKSILYAPSLDLLDDPTALSEFPSSIKRILAKGTKMLGAIISNDEDFVTSFIQEILTRHTTALSNIGDLEDAQTSFRLMRFCWSFCKYQHLLRTTPPALCANGAAAIDLAIHETMESIFGCSIDPFTAKVLSLPVNLGGAGITSCVDLSEISFLASVEKTKAPTQNLIANDDNITTALSYPNRVLCSVTDALSRIASKNPGFVGPIPAFSIECDGVSSPTTGSSLQKALTLAYHTASVENLRASTDVHATTTKKALLLSGAQPHARAWLNAAPTLNLRMHHETFQVAFKLNFGIDFLRPDDRSICPICNRCVDMTAHALNCQKGGEKGKRHDSIKRVIYNFVKNCFKTMAFRFPRKKGADLIPSQPTTCRPTPGTLREWETPLPRRHCHKCHKQR